MVPWLAALAWGGSGRGRNKFDFCNQPVTGFIANNSKPGRLPSPQKNGENLIVIKKD